MQVSSKRAIWLAVFCAALSCALGAYHTVLSWDAAGEAERKLSKSALSSIFGKLIMDFENALDKRKELTPADTDRSFNRLSVDSRLPQDTVQVSSKFGGVFLQAPHRIADKHTGDLVQKLTAAEAVDTVFVNQRHRREFDYSRESNSILIDLSLSYLRRTPNGIVVQVHGYAREKRATKAAQDAEIIISSGHPGMIRLPLGFAGCLRDEGFKGVSVYGKDVDELGGTLNPIKRALYRHRFHRFLHIEMSLLLRKRLMSSRDHRRRFIRCLNTLVTV